MFLLRRSFFVFDFFVSSIFLMELVLNAIVVVLQLSISLHSRTFQHVNLSLHLEQLVLWQHYKFHDALFFKMCILSLNHVLCRSLLRFYWWVSFSFLLDLLHFVLRIVYEYFSFLQCFAFNFFRSTFKILVLTILINLWIVGCWNWGQVWHWLCTGSI